MNIKGIDMEKLLKEAARMGKTREDLEKALRLNKSTVARLAGAYSSDGSGDKE
ncbi:hypothetical protein [Actinomadura sp. WMMB 499]|uniref:hypothetical protein n=1 Tax=Actinomadura sp. WMMB 499 TaxID=1219491 RepID=UPI00159DA3D0|nr:hypothetical protein [Actinomadura sp. WMMB 499]